MLPEVLCLWIQPFPVEMEQRHSTITRKCLREVEVKMLHIKAQRINQKKST